MIVACGATLDSEYICFQTSIRLYYVWYFVECMVDGDETCGTADVGHLKVIAVVGVAFGWPVISRGRH